MPLSIAIYVGCLCALSGMLWWGEREYKRGVQDGVRVMKKEQEAKASRIIHDMKPAMETFGLSKKAAEDTVALMDAAQRGVENMMAGGMRKKGEEIEAPKRTQWRGEVLDHDKFKPTDPSTRNLRKGIHQRIERS